MLQVLEQLNVFSNDDMEEASKALNDVSGSISYYILLVNKIRKLDISLIFVNLFSHIDSNQEAVLSYRDGST